MAGCTISARLTDGRAEPYPARVRVDAEGVVESVEHLESSPDKLGVVAPGLVDVHNHGGARGAFPTGTLGECRQAAEFHRQQGSVHLLASLVSGTEEELTRQVGVLAPLVAEGVVDGIHLEGPFIHTAKCGAQAPDRIQDGDPAMLRRILERGAGTVRQLTFAPETPNARALVDVCVEYGVIVSLGHTTADFATTAGVLDYAVARGATVTATHLFNAMPPLHHRQPGAVGAMLAAAVRGEAAVEAIGDGVHLADGTVDVIASCAGEGLVLVTDAMEAAGMPDGAYRLGPLDVVVAGGVARLAGVGGAIAGGTSTLAQQFVRFSARHGAAAAARAAAMNPGRLLSLDQARGLQVGQPAEFVEFDPAGAVRTVFAGGTRLRG